MLGPSFLISFALVSYASAKYYEPAQACRYPDKSPIEWRPKANDTRVFNVGKDAKKTREIRVSIPPTYNISAPPPLIVAFHDKELGTAEFEYISRLSDGEANKDAVVVYPLAKNDTWQSDIVLRRWQKDAEKAKKRFSDDLGWVKELLSDLDTVVCFDTQRVHTTGLGTGGGMVHLLACDPELSTKFASYAIVAGGFGTKKTGAKWAECNPGYLPLPILEIHGEDDSILPYLLNDWEVAKSRVPVPIWLEEWSERNQCGEPVGETMEGVDGTGTAVKITRLERNGWVSEAEAYGGAAYRIAKSCPGRDHDTKSIPPVVKYKDVDDESGETAPEAEGEDEKEQRLVTSPAAFTLLHYRIKDFGHGWPTLQLKSKEEKGESKLFDATALILDWFKIHKLPEPDGEIIKEEDIPPEEYQQKQNKKKDHLVEDQEREQKVEEEKLDLTQDLADEHDEL